MRSPIELLGAIVDEVTGLRRTHAASFLPDALVREAREALGDTPSREAPGLGAGAQLNDIADLTGRTISAVFDNDLRRGDVVIVCQDGSFIVLEAENDGDSAYISTVRVFNRGTLESYLRPRALQAAGLMTDSQRIEAERQERIQQAQAQKERAEARLKLAQAALAKLHDSPASQGAAK